MTRSRTSARAAGTWLERVTAEFLAAQLGADITREPKHGAKDRGDIHGVRLGSRPLVIECKNTTRMDLPGWWREAEVERANADAAGCVVVHKRHGSMQPYQQWVSMDLATFAWLVARAGD